MAIMAGFLIGQTLDIKKKVQIKNYNHGFIFILPWAGVGQFVTLAPGVIGRMLRPVTATVWGRDRFILIWPLLLFCLKWPGTRLLFHWFHCPKASRDSLIVVRVLPQGIGKTVDSGQWTIASLSTHRPSHAHASFPTSRAGRGGVNLQGPRLPNVDRRMDLVYSCSGTRTARDGVSSEEATDIYRGIVS
jgi:hypothetical protein